MNFSKIKDISRMIFNVNHLRVSRNMTTKKKFVEPPAPRKEKLQVTGFGKFLFVSFESFSKILTINRMIVISLFQLQHSRWDHGK